MKNNFSQISGKSFDPSLDSELVAMVNVSGAIGGKITIKSIEPIGAGNFGFVLAGLYATFVKSFLRKF